MIIEMDSLDQVKEVLNEYKNYMRPAISENQLNHDNIISVGKSLMILRSYASSREFGRTYYFKLMISDIFSCLYAIKKQLPSRFFYFSYRSAIESFLRSNSGHKSNTKDMTELFNDFKETNKEILQSKHLIGEFYQTIRSIYRKSSGYVHGNPQLSFNIKNSIEDIGNQDKDHSALLIELNKLITLFKKFYLTKDNDLAVLKHVYLFRIEQLRYLLSKSENQLFFSSTSPLEDTE
ncbi:hypothetical protein D5F11_016280 [Siminovitchia terrae]|uniref:Cthe-2314-like HEPN domain-containing protein n=1 Tax=Siminovitchia terrae TaxID=1914933 RepID=A0A429X5M2_SIMTE|nr:hypothetical protein [Siminovitchia terrae]RST58591.1 hypothetical protein D5F11_016280 [Siminovitchia terrae]